MAKTRIFRDLGTDEIYTLDDLKTQFETMKAENREELEGWTFSVCLAEWLRNSDLVEVFSFSIRYSYEFARKIHIGKRCVIAKSTDDAVKTLDELLLDDHIGDYNVLEVTRT